jgi:hypothetical protein
MLLIFDQAAARVTRAGLTTAFCGVTIGRMFNLMKPGHILRFGTCPSTIASPAAPKNIDRNNNAAETLWSTTSSLGNVHCLSHPSGAIGAIAAAVATGLRTTPSSLARSAGYSAVGRLVTASNRLIGTQACDFVGYVDGRSNYVASARTVFSKDFSGCLMVAYVLGGGRRVAHVAASAVPPMDCKQAFLNTLQERNAVLTGWFRPFIGAQHAGRKVTAFGVIRQYVASIDGLTTFGVVTAGNEAYSVDAFKPLGVGGNDWVVTNVTAHTMSQSWVVR